MTLDTRTTCSLTLSDTVKMPPSSAAHLGIPDELGALPVDALDGDFVVLQLCILLKQLVQLSQQFLVVQFLRPAQISADGGPHPVQPC